MNVWQTLSYFSYSDRKLVDLLAAVLESGELSKRVLALTQDVLSENPAHYTAWSIRRQCLRALFFDASLSRVALLDAIRYEVAMMDGMLEAIPKVYQTWHHRELFYGMVQEAGALTDADRAAFIEGEWRIVKLVLAIDAKNYHAWSFLTHVVRTEGQWGRLLGLTGAMIGHGPEEEGIPADIRNNSAWAARMTAVKAVRPPMADEVALAVAAIRQAPNNESPWLYLRGLTDMDPAVDTHALVTDLVDGWTGDVSFPCAMSYRIEGAQMAKTKGKLQEDERVVAQRLCDEMVVQDVLRAAYWAQVKEELG